MPNSIRLKPDQISYLAQDTDIPPDILGKIVRVGMYGGDIDDLERGYKTTARSLHRDAIEYQRLVTAKKNHLPKKDIPIPEDVHAKPDNLDRLIRNEYCSHDLLGRVLQKLCGQNVQLDETECVIYGLILADCNDWAGNTEKEAKRKWEQRHDKQVKQREEDTAKMLTDNLERDAKKACNPNSDKKKGTPPPVTVSMVAYLMECAKHFKDRDLEMRIQTIALGHNIDMRRASTKREISSIMLTLSNSRNDTPDSPIYCRTIEKARSIVDQYTPTGAGNGQQQIRAIQA